MTATETSYVGDLFSQYDHAGRNTKTIQERFERFHMANPHIYREIVKLARRARARGFDSWSINGIFEVLRWHISMHTDEEEPRLSNDYRSRYARLVMKQEGDLDGFFVLRELRAP